MKRIEKYGLVILRDGRFLINRKSGTKLFLMPGGKPNTGEAIEDCLIREIKEEHDCGLIKESIKFIGEYGDVAANEPDTMVVIKLYIGKIIGEPKTGSEIEEQRWFGKTDNPNTLSPIIKNKILPDLIEKKII